MFHKSDNTFTSHHQMYIDFDRDPVGAPRQSIPDTAGPVDVVVHEHTVTLKQNTCQWNLPPQPIASPTILAAIPIMPEWQQVLLSNLTLLTNEEDIIETLNSAAFILASDGSAPGDKASFGWTLSTITGWRLATCNGPVYGYKATSYRAEGYGILSGCQFILQLRQIHQVAIPWEWTLICDNESMVKKAQMDPAMDRIFPQSTLDSDWDVLAEIWTTITMLRNDSSRPTVKHIKGHQDDTRSYHELSLNAQLNVDADKLADEYINHNPNHEYHNAPLLPTSGAQIHLPSGTVTYHLKRTLTHARTVQPLQAKLCKRNDWTADTFKLIDWEAHRRGLNRHDKHRTTLIKYLHGILPVGKLVHRYDKKYPEECPSCNAPVETQDHLFHCMAQPRRDWKAKFIRALRDRMEDMDTDLGTMDLLLDAVYAVIHGHDTTQITVPSGLEDVAHAQALIGWNQILKGRLATQWQQRRTAYLGDRATSKDNGITWSTTIVDTIFKQWWKLWELRNEDRHGRDLQSQKQAEHRQAIREMTQLYQLKPFLPQDIQWIVGPELQTRLHWSTSVMRAWINSYKPILEKGYTDALATG